MDAHLERFGFQYLPNQKEPSIYNDWQSFGVLFRYWVSVLDMLESSFKYNFPYKYHFFFWRGTCLPRTRDFSWRGDATLSTSTRHPARLRQK
jgi:hypothetical protein